MKTCLGREGGWCISALKASNCFHLYLAGANETHAILAGKAELRSHIKCENHGTAEDVLSPAWDDDQSYTQYARHETCHQHEEDVRWG